MAFVVKSKKIKEVKKDKPPKIEKSVHPKKGTPRIMTAAILANPGGRPSAFDEASPKILKYLRKGNTYECSCACSRISYDAFNDWIKKGKSHLKQGLSDSKYAKFFQDVQKAEMDAEEEVLGHWKDCIPGNWQAAKEFLARRNPDKWGNREKVDVTSNGETVSQPVYLPVKDSE